MGVGTQIVKRITEASPSENQASENGFSSFFSDTKTAHRIRAFPSGHWQR
jgi:hypothetical protein